MIQQIYIYTFCQFVYYYWSMYIYFYATSSCTCIMTKIRRMTWFHTYHTLFLTHTSDMTYTLYYDDYYYTTSIYTIYVVIIHSLICSIAWFWSKRWTGFFSDLVALPVACQSADSVPLCLCVDHEIACHSFLFVYAYTKCT